MTEVWHLPDIIWTPWRKALAATTAVIALAGAGTGIGVWARTIGQPVSCGPSLVQRGPQHECVGLTTGDYVFAPQLASIERKIAAENGYAAARQHVSIALLMSLTDVQDPTVMAELMHTIQGAYAAQYRANNQSQDEKPYIELLLANDGVNDAEWLPVVQQLAGPVGAAYQIRAVTGISTSHAATKQATMWLSQHGIPVVGDAITADDIANTARSSPYPTLARIAPTNTDEAAALAHLDSINPQTTVLVEDHHADDYVASLAAAFASSLRGGKYEPEEYTSPTSYSDEGDTAGQFRQMVLTLCETNASLILFAGRHVQLRQFVNQLGARGCQNHSFTILTGDDASHLAHDGQLHRTALADGITVEYAALAYPGSAAPTWQSGYNYFTMAMRAAGLPTTLAELSDGQAIMAHDAVWTAITAIRNLTAQSEAPDNAQIADEWRLLKGPNMINGASGLICLDNQGNPYDKPVPVVAVTSSGQPSFVKLTWPTGKPPTPPCGATSGELQANNLLRYAIEGASRVIPPRAPCSQIRRLLPGPEARSRS